MTKEQLVKLFDHTCLYAYATEAHMKKLCDEARAYNFAMVAVNSVQVKLCKKFLKDTDVHVGAAIGFLSARPPLLPRFLKLWTPFRTALTRSTMSSTLPS